MYLSRIEINPNKRATMAAFSSLNHFHGAVERTAPFTHDRKLWRIDRLYGKTYLLMVTPQQPDFTPIQENFGGEMNGETVDYSRLLDRIEKDSFWHFRLVANPTKSTFISREKRGATTAFVSEEDQMQWLMRVSEKKGFAVTPKSFAITEKKWYKFVKHKDEQKSRVTILSVTYEGVLQVTDTEKFKHTLISGIGREKAYGMGMMTIVRADHL